MAPSLTYPVRMARGFLHEAVSQVHGEWSRDEQDLAVDLLLRVLSRMRRPPAPPPEPTRSELFLP